MRRRRFSTLGLIVVAIVLVGPVDPLMAEKQFDGRLITDKWYVSLGTSSSSFNTEGQIGLGSVLGTFIRLEDDLELDDNQSVFRINGFYAFNRKHVIDFTFGSVSRQETSTIDKQFTIANPDDGELVTFLIGAQIQTAFQSDSAKIFYKYAFQNTGRLRAGIGAGLSVFDYKLEFTGDGEVDDGSGSIVFKSTAVSEHLLAPIPSMMLFVDYALTQRLILRTHAGFFRLDLDDIEGRLIETRLTLDYFFAKHFGVGLGLEGSDISYRERDDKPIFVDVSQSSIVLYVGVAF